MSRGGDLLPLGCRSSPRRGGGANHSCRCPVRQHRLPARGVRHTPDGGPSPGRGRGGPAVLPREAEAAISGGKADEQRHMQWWCWCWWHLVELAFDSQVEIPVPPPPAPLSPSPSLTLPLLPPAMEARPLHPTPAEPRVRRARVPRCTPTLCSWPPPLGDRTLRCNWITAPRNSPTLNRGRGCPRSSTESCAGSIGDCHEWGRLEGDPGGAASSGRGSGASAAGGGAGHAV